MRGPSLLQPFIQVLFTMSPPRCDADLPPSTSNANRLEEVVIGMSVGSKPANGVLPDSNGDASTVNNNVKPVGSNGTTPASTSGASKAKANGSSAHHATSSLDDAKLQKKYQGVPRLLVESGFLLFRFFYSDLGRRCLKTIPRDLLGLYTLFSVKLMIRRALRRNAPLHHYFLDSVKEHPDKLCVVEVETGKKYTFVEFNELANKYANYFKAKGYKKDDVVALFMENGAEFFAIWLGLSKLGVITAWINSNLKQEPLAHSIRVSNAKSIIVSPSLLPTLNKTISEGLLEDTARLYTSDALEREISDASEPAETPGLDFHSVLCYIYTSGTTGNPKPAVIKHFRYFWIAGGAGKAFGIYKTDSLYVMMPMYHSAAGILGIGQVVVRGCTAVIRKKFSASNFWKDCADHKCTVSQYIGEICRYLLASKSNPHERLHNIRLMFGNGLRGEIWPDFVNRFGIKQIGELYGSTEGNSNIVNIDNHVGACGFFPIYPYITALYPVRLLKVDPESGEIVRDSNGLAITCRPGDTGEMVGMIKEHDPLLRFEGYVNREDTDKKLIRNVVKHGDAVFSSGDILYWDPLGYLHFKDRRGDTYRWRGENVSTMEVEGILQPIMAIEDATVYGVEVKGREGKAGMIGVTLAGHADVDTFLRDSARLLSENLASYAIPVFLRICKEVDKTGTFKLKKTLLQKDGFDVEKCHGDPLYYWDPTDKAYHPMDAQMQADIESGAYNKI
uniref:Very long-chain fatty acid transport protein n=1 Tax=Panagrellus redivivus TaxID=6233 RepID=A0A7E5A1M5_PANRE